MTDKLTAEMREALEATLAKIYEVNPTAKRPEPHPDDVDLWIAAVEWAKANCKRRIRELTDQNTALSDALDYLHGLTHQQFLDKTERRIAEAVAQAIERAARRAERWPLVPPDGGSPTDEECRIASAIAEAIRAELRGE